MLRNEWANSNKQNLPLKFAQNFIVLWAGFRAILAESEIHVKKPLNLTKERELSNKVEN